METYASDIFFTPAVKAVQAQRGSRDAYHEHEAAGFRTAVTPDLRAKMGASWCEALSVIMHFMHMPSLLISWFSLF